MKLVITGGGTGGHIFAGVAIAQEFKAQSKANEVLFIGSEYGLETRLVPKSGFNLETLHLGKLVGQNIFTRLLTLVQIPIAIFKCLQILRKFKTDMVVGVGGYAAGPCIIAARILGIPIGVLEQNSVMGFTNRISAALAQHVFIAFEEIPIGAPPQKCVFTGNPARSNMTAASVKSQKPFVIFAFGGSQGATGINRLMTEAAAELKNDSTFTNLQWVHQTGERDFDWVCAKYKELGITAEVFKFIDDMQTMYNRAAVVICRAGSGTISELGATKNAAVFVPFPFAAGNHQEVNAKIVERAGAARVLVQDKTTGKTDSSALVNMIREWQKNPSEIEDMRSKMAQFFRPDAAKRIVDLMKTHVLHVQKK